MSRSCFVLYERTSSHFPAVDRQLSRLSYSRPSNQTVIFLLAFDLLFPIETCGLFTSPMALTTILRQAHSIAISVAALVVYLACLVAYRLLWQDSRDSNSLRSQFGMSSTLTVSRNVSIHSKSAACMKYMALSSGSAPTSFMSTIPLSSMSFASMERRRGTNTSYSTSQFGIPDSVFGTTGHDMHRIRRCALNRSFSKASVTKLEPIIHKAVEKLISQSRGYSGGGRPTTMTMAFNCMTTDVVTDYAFDTSYKLSGLPKFRAQPSPSHYCMLRYGSLDETVSLANDTHEQTFPHRCCST